MKGEQRGRTWRRGLTASLLCVSLLTGCAPTVLLPEKPLSAGDPLAGAVIDPKTGYQLVVRTASGADAVAQAAQNLEAMGVLSAGERQDLSRDTTLSRADFISLVARALGGEAPEAQPGETRYARWVKTGYRQGLFSHSGEDMTFTPTDGFRMGEKGYSEMEQLIGRSDAAAILAHAYLAKSGQQLILEDGANRLEREIQLVTEQDLLPALADGEFHGDSNLSKGEALVCAWKLAQLPGTVNSTSATALPLAEALKLGRVIHAGGRIPDETGKNRTYTNSAEALVNAYRKGNRVIELDFSQTSDGHLACIHGWSGRYSADVTDGVPLSLQEWREARIYGSLTPLYLESVADFMRQHPDLYIVTNVKDDNIAAAAKIAQACPDLLDRFVIQIYHDDEYAPVAELGFSHIIYTLYNLSVARKQDTEHWREYAAEHPLAGYTFPQEWFEKEGYVEAMLQTGIPLMVHTIDKQEDVDACYAAGITAVYTNMTE